MRIRRLHSWHVTPRKAIQIQERLRAHVLVRGRLPRPTLIAGADLAFDKATDAAIACVVVLRFPALDPVETVVQRARCRFPYVPGLLSFREAPCLLQAFARLRQTPDVIFIDGHGYSHPRKFGLACHIGLLLDRPVIGCAKSLLAGTYREPGRAKGSVSDILDRDGDVIGAVVRTRDGVNPVFVSVGHKVGLPTAVRLTLACAPRYRVPEPTRLADILAEQAKREFLSGTSEGRQGAGP
ncbi:MAG: deoxyribonuclease V [Nitrospirales bacterium]